MSSRISGANSQQQSRRRKPPQTNRFPPPQPQPPPLFPTTYQFDHTFPPQTTTSYPMAENDVFMQGCLDDLDFCMHQADNKSASATTSFYEVGNESPSVVTEDGSGSFVRMAHNRSYSENSQASSGGVSDFPLYPSPSGDELSQEWVGVAEFAVDKEAMDEDVAMQHDVQSNMSDCSPEPQTAHDAYCHTPALAASPFLYQNFDQFAYQPMDQFVAPARTEPWTPVDPQVLNYPSGFVAFPPSPGRHGMEAMYAASVSSGPQSPESYIPKIRKNKHTKPSAKGNVKPKAKEMLWENAVVSKHGLEVICVQSKKKSSGVRTGALDDAAREKARIIRKLGACWPCWLNKVNCSEGTTCDRCQKQLPGDRQLQCFRSSFKEYATAFFPDFLCAHLKKSEIEDFISEHSSGFRDTTLTVEVSTGATFTPMKILVNVFDPKTWELLQHTGLEGGKIVEKDSVPVGILCLTPSEMRKTCTDHIKRMVENRGYTRQTTAGDTTRLPAGILEIVQRYCAAKTERDPLIERALSLHALQYSMSSLITFSPASATKIYQTLDPYSDLPADPFLTSRLLNRQLKHIMNKLQRDLTSSLLQDLEKSMRTRSKYTWGPAFCTILVLCLCIEGLQTAADTFILTSLLKGEGKYSRKDSTEACETLDEYPFGMCTRLFHEIYKSHREGNGGGKEQGFNPLVGKGEGMLDKETEEMVKRVGELVGRNWEEIVNLADHSVIDLEEDAQPWDVKSNNTGRLAAKFLKSFYTEV